MTAAAARTAAPVIEFAGLHKSYDTGGSQVHALRGIDLRIDRGFEARGMRSARILRERREPIRLVAAGAIGAFGYFSRLPILDLYGLVDATIARSRGPDAEWRAGFIPGHQRSK